MKKLTTEEWISKAKEVHGDKYDYSKSKYTNSRNKIKIICPIHGEFEQVAHDHLLGHGCYRCCKTTKFSLSDFIKQAIEIHGDKYDYSKVNYKSMREKVCIICHKHGEFWQLPSSHLNGCGCPKCSGIKLTTEEWISKAKEVHGDKYDYSKSKYTNSRDKVKIICPTHGEFEQTPSKHLQGQGCPKCAFENRVNKQFLTTSDFIKKAIEIHGDKYDYSKVNYKSMREKVCIICHKHGEFWQYPFDHINEHGCNKCGMINSKSEEEIYNYLCEKIGKDEIIMHDRTVLNGKEIDIYLPKYKVGIEYNGLLWHSEKYNKDKYYHLNKMKLCNDKGIKLIQVFEDEYKNKKNIVLHKISHILNIDSKLPKIYARKCEIKKINYEDSYIFLNKYHIQGYGKCTISYGCYFNNELIGVMSFRKYKTNSNVWELVRFATNYNYICCGVGGKLFNEFTKTNEVNQVYTFADRRWTIDLDNNLYLKIGFVEYKINKPDYRYIDPNNPNDRMHKFSFRKWNIHKKYGIPMSFSETQMCNELGFYKIWDCGLVKYVWENKPLL